MIGLLSMQKVNSSYVLNVLPRAFLIFLVCLSLVAFTSYTAPKAQAEAFTLTLTSAFIMLVIAVMGTLGVTLASSSDDNAVEYISVAFGQFLRDVKGTTSSIADFLSSIGLGAIGLLGAPIHGAISIGKLAYDLIAEFCTWFFSEKEIVSNGEPVGNLTGGISVEPIGSASLTWLSSSEAQTTYSWNWTSSSAGLVGFKLNGYFPANTNITLSISNFTAWRNNGVLINRAQCRFLNGGYNNIDFYNSTSGVERATISIPADCDYIRFMLSNQYTYNGQTRYKAGSATNATFNIIFSSSVNEQNGFLITPSDSVLTPPSIALGQTYNVPAEGVTDSTEMEAAIPASIAPLTTTGGLSNFGTVAGTAVPAEYEWLYEDTQAIRNNTDPHFDFIPSTLGFDFSIWHYVTEMMSSVSSAIALFGTFVQNMPPAILVFPFGVFALCITVALFRRFLS